MKQELPLGTKIFIPFKENILIGTIVESETTTEPFLVPSVDEGIPAYTMPGGIIFHRVEIMLTEKSDNKYFPPGSTHTFSEELVFPLHESTE